MIAAFLIGGALLELAGFGLAAWDVYDARLQWVTLSHDDKLVQVGLATEHDRALGMAAAGGATRPLGTPPLEERVASMERELVLIVSRLDQEAERHVRTTVR